MCFLLKYLQNSLKYTPFDAPEGNMKIGIFYPEDYDANWKSQQCCRNAYVSTDDMFNKQLDDDLI